MIYVCSPFRGDTENNVKFARECCKKVLNAGLIPYAPHLFFPQFLNDNDPIERELGLHAGLSVMRYCDELWVFGETITQGMQAEIEYAHKTGKGVKYLGQGCNL